VGIVIRPEILIRELARRGWNFADLAKSAGLSGATVTAAKAGRPVSPRTVRLIAQALAAAPPLDGVDELLPAHSAPRKRQSAPPPSERWPGLSPPFG
jgi:lambda repressor-like predicted transcriptional regulator